MLKLHKLDKLHNQPHTDANYLIDYNLAIDPYEADYVTYLTYAALTSIQVQYTYEETVDPYDQDIDDEIDDTLTILTDNDDDTKMVIAIAVMAGLAVFVGIFTKSPALVLIILSITYLTFTILGWLDLWIAIIITIVFVLYGVYLLFKKGS